MEQLPQIRLVVERYSELQGLRVAYAGVLWVAFGSALAVQAHLAPLELLAAFLGMVALYVPGNWMLSRYYRSRFGRIVVRPTGRVNPPFVLALAWIAIANGFFGFHPVSAAFFIVAVASLWTAIRDWPVRGYYIVGSAAGAVAAATQFGSDPAFGPTHAAGCAIVGLGYLVLGLLDHRLLASVMARRPEAGLQPLDHS